MFIYALEAFDVAPILALCSPLKRCGKTTTEEVTTALAKRPLAAANISVAALYRTVERFTPTLIVDEADTFLRNNLALRGIINSGQSPHEPLPPPISQLSSMRAPSPIELRNAVRLFSGHWAAPPR